MNKAIATLVLCLTMPLSASAFLDHDESQNQDQDQAQGQQQGQLQGQAQANLQGQLLKDGDTETITETITETRVTVPKQHRPVPDITINSSPGQSGAGISGPGFSIGGAKTEPIPAAAQFIELCKAAGENACSQKEIDDAVDYAKSQIKTCYFLGPLGHFVTFVGDKIKLESLDLEGDGYFACF